MHPWSESETFVSRFEGPNRQVGQTWCGIQEPEPELVDSGSESLNEGHECLGVFKGGSVSVRAAFSEAASPSLQDKVA
jgi:hypothetical protein